MTDENIISDPYLLVNGFKMSYVPDTIIFETNSFGGGSLTFKFFNRLKNMLELSKFSKRSIVIVLSQKDFVVTFTGCVLSKAKVSYTSDPMTEVLFNCGVVTVSTEVKS